MLPRCYSITGHDQARSADAAAMLRNAWTEIIPSSSAAIRTARPSAEEGEGPGLPKVPSAAARDERRSARLSADWGAEEGGTASIE